MKTIYVFLAAALVTAVPMFAAAPAASNAKVEVNYVHPEKFTDVKDSWMGTDKGRDAYLNVITEYLQKRAPRYLADGQTLTMTFTDIDLAGDFEPNRGPSAGDVRIIKDIYPPRMDFTYKLVDAGGATVKEGKEHLVDMGFQMNASPLDHTSMEELPYEKTMLDNWLSKEFRH